MPLTKMHFAAFAALAHRVWMQNGRMADRPFLALVDEMMDYFKQDNPRFDRDRFIEAMGFDPEVELEKLGREQ